MLAPEDAPPLVRMTDCIFEISRAHSTLAGLYERLFVTMADLAHGSDGDDS
jgi:hypothetical protein|tara:strand:- start:865 stop:1017 length:153 start_codon:yes stop_codon:yes gene_type:complete